MLSGPLKDLPKKVVEFAKKHKKPLTVLGGGSLWAGVDLLLTKHPLTLPLVGLSSLFGITQAYMAWTFVEKGAQGARGLKRKRTEETPDNSIIQELSQALAPVQEDQVQAPEAKAPKAAETSEAETPEAKTPEAETPEAKAPRIEEPRRFLRATRSTTKKAEKEKMEALLVTNPKMIKAPKKPVKNKAVKSTTNKRRKFKK